jgi:hypothetical protein
MMPIVISAMQPPAVMPIITALLSWFYGKRWEWLARGV